jgi:hypothetical protein
MGKYADLEKDIFSVFATVLWKAEKIKTYPANVQAISTGESFIRVSIIPSGSGINLKSISGVVIIDIFISAGSGPNSASLIADKLDTYLVGKSLSTQTGRVTQFQNSSLAPIGTDPDNPTLYRSSYTIQFSYFGA